MEKDLSRIKVALLGPPNSGKSTYKAVLFGNDPERVEIPIESVEQVTKARKYKKMVKGEMRPADEYLLNLVDLPGRKRFHDQRLKAIASGAIGTLLFYDATDPSSIQQLAKMVKEELIKTEYIENQMGIVLLGGKMGGDVSVSAVKTAEKLRERLSSIITPIWEYNVPHFLISSREKRDVILSFWVLETFLLSSKEIPERVKKKYSATEYLEAAKEEKPRKKKVEEREPKEVREKPPAKSQPPKEVPSPPQPSKVEEKTETKEKEAPPSIEEAEEEREPEVKPEGKPEVPPEREPEERKPEVKPEGKPEILDYSLSLYPLHRKAWKIPERLVKGHTEIVKCVVGRVGGDELYLAFYPGEKSIENVPKMHTKLLLHFHSMIQAYEGTLNQATISTEKDRWFMMFNKEGSFVLIETKSEPSQKIKNLL